MARPRKYTEAATERRKGLYIMAPTRERLNAYKERLSLRLAKPVSQDDAINLLLDHAETEPAPAVQA